MSANGANGVGWLLAIDTSADLVSLALAPVTLDTPGGELSWLAPRNQTATLLTEIDHLCQLCGIETDAFAGIAVATGPGGFNALRVGMSVAKGFSFALGIPIFGVGTLDVAAHTVAGYNLPVRAFVPAGRGRVVYTDYVLLGGTRGGTLGGTLAGRLVQQGETAHRWPQDLGGDLATRTVLSGDLSAHDAEELAKLPNVVVPPASVRRRRAATLIDLVLPRWRDGEWDDLTDLEPIYIHQQPDAAARTDAGTLS
jgi:tRNA threonylcarbamoyladenosine biosynthesis protein TsaB